MMKFTGLKGKVAIVTGASSGIGQGQAIGLAREGVKVIAIGRNKEGLQKTVDQIGIEGGEAIAMTADITDSARLKEIVDFTVEKYGEINIVCNTAGIYDKHKKTLEIEEAYFSQILNTNVVPIFVMCHLVLPHMLKQGGGVILNMSSLAGKTGGAGGSAYVASKHAIYGYTKNLCVEYADQGIRANAICPGSVTTPFIADNVDADGSKRKNLIPCKRFGTVEDIANLTVFLASDQANWIHGAGISIDGGRNAKG